jgi:transposase
MTLAYFLVCTGDALVHADAWCRNHEVPAAGPYISQRISDWLSAITEDGRQSFFKAWSKQVSEQDFLCYDITSVSSYSELNEYVHYGYNRDGEALPQVNLAMVYGQKSELPVYYRILPGAISDVRTLKTLLDSLDKLDYPRIQLVMDRGFYSQKNVTGLLGRHYNFILAVPIHLKWVRSVIDQCQDATHSPRGYRQLDQETAYMHTERIKWPVNQRRCYLHIYYNPHRAADDFEELTKRLLLCKQELENGQRNEAHENDYEQYFTVKNTPVRGLQVDYNDEAISRYRRKYAGYYAIISSGKMEAFDVLRIYRNKDEVEKSFDNLKNQLDMKRLRIHSSGRMASRFFIQFIALILHSQIQRVAREHGLSNRYSPRLLLDEMESLTRIRYNGRYKAITSEVSKSQREVLEAFGLDPNTL